MTSLRPVPVLGAALIALFCVPVAIAGEPLTADTPPSARAASCGGLQPTLKGSRGDDTGEDKLRGTGEQDVISAGRGNDLAVGRGGDDVLCGGPGKDVLKGGAGEDLCIGGPGRDKTRGCEPVLVAPPVTPPPTDPPPDVDDPPAAVGDSATVAEDSSASAIDVLGNDTDSDGGPKTVNAVTAPANGVAAITGGGSGLTYAPDANYCNEPGAAPADTFTYTLNGGSTATVSVTVTCVSDAPTDIALSNSSVAENQAPGAVVGNFSSVDPDAGQTHTYTLEPGSGDTDNGSFAIVGNQLRTAATFNFETKSSYSIRVQSADSGGALRLESFTIAVTNVDEPPLAINDSATVAEDAGATAVSVLTNDTDVDGGTKTINAVTPPANGVTTITGGGTGLTYRPNANYCNQPPGTTPDTFNYTLNGGSTATVSVTVTCVNDVPVVAGAGVIDHGENEGAETLAPALTVTDVDSPVTSATVTITNAQTGDQLSWNDTFPTVAGSGMGTGTVTLTGSSGSVSPTDMQAALRAVRYHTIDDTPVTTQRQVTFRVTDSGGALSAVNAGSTVLVNLTAQNDVPIITGAPASPVAWTDVGGSVTLAPNLNVFDGESDNIASATVTNTTPQTGDCLQWADPTPGGAAPNISSVACADTLTLTGAASLAAYQAALRQVIFDSTGPSTADRTIRFQVTDVNGGISGLHPGNTVTVDVIT